MVNAKKITVKQLEKKKITIEELEVSLHDWDNHILQSVKYRDKIIKYMRKISENNLGTTPPGNPPITPPGVPTKPIKA